MRKYTAPSAFVLGASALALLFAVQAMAQGLPGQRRGNNSSNNSNLPIEIAADNLEVLQERQLAIFRGNVDVAQGDMRLRADELVVYYRDRNNAQPPAQAQGQRPAQQRPAAPVPSAGGPDMGAISRIEAKGKVFISSADEKAQGDYADYNVDKKLIVLQGNVVLTQKESVLRCAKVTMQQDIGRSVCDPLPGQRVIGVFRQGG